MILTVDLGTSVTKVALWGDDGPVATTRFPVDTVYLPGGRVEQDPDAWWAALVAACAACPGAAGATEMAAGGAAGVMEDVRAVAFSAARQTFVPVAADGTTLGSALVWSDRRAGDEATALAVALGGEGGSAGLDGTGRDDARTDVAGHDGTRPDDAGAGSRRIGMRLDAGSVAAKVAWLAAREPDRLREARWLLGPRDLLVWRLTGAVTTDWSMASATGLYETAPGRYHADELIRLDATLVERLPTGVSDMLPGPVASHAVVGELLPHAAASLHLPAGIPVVVGAGDRACEVLGTGASPQRPMVSWGTTANVSIPVDELPATVPDGLIVTRGAGRGWLLEGGLAAAGSLADWLSRLTGIDLETVAHHAATSPPGANGVVVLPWFGGARAPWWRDGARGAIVGLALDHRLGDVGRAVVESVAWDVTRCLETAAVSGPFDGLVLGGGGATVALWTEILTAVSGLAATRRRSGEAASAGAAVLAARALGDLGALGALGALGDVSPLLDRWDPVHAEIAPDPTAQAAYRGQRAVVDAAADAVIALDFGNAGAPRG